MLGHTLFAQSLLRKVAMWVGSPSFGFSIPPVNEGPLGPPLVTIFPIAACLREFSLPPKNSVSV